MTSLDHNSHYDIYSHICLPHFSCVNNPIFAHGQDQGYSRRWPDACSNCSLLTSLLAQRLSFLWWAVSVFFPEKYYWSFVYMKWFISTFLSPLPGSLEIAKNPKVPHADAESSLDVLGGRPWVHECAYHKSNWTSTAADPKWSGPLYTCPSPLWKEGDCVQEMEGGRTKGKVGERQRENFARIK